MIFSRNEFTKLQCFSSIYNNTRPNILLLATLFLLIPHSAFANHGDLGLGGEACPDIEEAAVYEMDVNAEDHQYFELAPEEASVTVTLTASISGGRCEVWGYDNGISNSCELQSGPVYPRLYRLYIYEKQGSRYQLIKVTNQYPASPASLSVNFGPGVHKLYVKVHANDVICELLEKDTLGKFFTIYVDVPPPTEKDGCCDSSGECKGNPCDASDGNKYQAEIDYQSPIQGLSIERHYNSRNNKDYGLGVGWSTPFLKRLEIGVNALIARRNKGGSEGFIYKNGQWESGANGSLSLSQTASSYTLTLPNGDVETYNLQGNIVSEAYKDYVLTYAYNVSNQLESVTNTYGHAITFTYGPDGHVATITTPNSETYQYTYDTFKNLITVTYPNTHTREYLYEIADLPNALTGINDENNVRYASFGYHTGTGWAVYSQHATTDNDSPQEKYTLLYRYYDGREVTVTDPVGNQQLLNFSTRLGVKKLDRSTDLADNKFFAQFYDSQNNLISRTDEESIKTRYSYNLENQRIDMTEAVGTTEERITTYEYYSPSIDLVTSSSRSSVNTGSQFVTTTTYDTNLKPDIISEAGFQPDGTAITRTIDMDYDNYGRIQQIDGPRTDVSDITQFSYYSCSTGNKCGQLQSIINALSQTTTFNQYDANGHVTKMTDPLGVISDFSYDFRGAVTSMTQTPLGGVSRTTIYTYYPTGLLHTITTPTGTVLTHEYDDAHDLKRITDNLGNKIEYRYDLSGNLTSEKIFDPQGALARVKDTSYDIRNRIATITEVGNITQVVHDAIGNLDQTTDANLHTDDHSYDRLNRLIQTLDALTGITSYQYDANDQIAQINAPNGAITQYVNDDFGRRLEEISPDRGGISYAYDTADNVTSLTQANGEVSNYTYDALNRLLQVSYPANPQENINYTYDENGAGQNGIGRLTGITDSSGSTAYQYDALGNLKKDSRTIGGVVYDINYEYNSDNQLIKIGYPSGRVVTYIRNSISRISSVTTQDSATSPVETLASSINYLPFGPLNSVQYGNNQTANFSYDQAYRLTDIDTSDGATVIQDWQYIFDPVNNVSGLVDLQDSNANQTYTYDAINRLDTGQGSYGDKNYDYDASGNRIVLTDNAVSTIYNYQADSNRLTDTADGTDNWIYSYDANGNTTRKIQDTATGTGFYYDYSARNRLTQVTEKLVNLVKVQGKWVPVEETLVRAINTYNALGQRTTKSTASAVTTYIYDKVGQLLVELDGEGNQIEYVYLDNYPLAIKQASNGSFTPEEVLMDNGDPGTSAVGSWVSTTSRKDYGADYLLASGATSSTYTWTPTLTAGDYEVYARWPSNAQYSSNVPYTVSHNGSQNTVYADHSANGGKWNNLGTYTFSGDGSEMLQVSDANGKTVADAVKFVKVGGSAVSETYFIHHNHLKTPVLMTDKIGQIVWSASYAPFGKATINEDVDGDNQPVTLNVRFPGQYYDAESGLHYNYFRDYDPSTGRYVQSDPIGLAGGLNTYAYVAGNPVNSIDPFGLKCNSQGCWLTPKEANLSKSGKYSEYYDLACANGDSYACSAKEVAANDGILANLTNLRLESSLKDNGWEGCEVGGVMENIRQELAQAHALALSGATESMPKTPSREEISKFHNEIFFDYGADPVFGGDIPLFGNFPFKWCSLPSCQP